MIEPIVILTIARSGSSMVAGIFAQHGVWTGPTLGPSKYNAKGYFESQGLRDFIRGNYDFFSLVENGRLAPRHKGFKKTIGHILNKGGYQDGPYLFKHNVLYYPLWHEFSPKFVCIRRNIDSVIESCKRTGYLKNMDALEPQIEALDFARDELGAAEVFTDEVLKGDFSSLKSAFSHCGIELDEQIARDFIDPSLWNFK